MPRPLDGRTFPPLIPRDALLYPLPNVQGTTARLRFLSVRESSGPDSGMMVLIRREIQGV